MEIDASTAQFVKAFYVTGKNTDVSGGGIWGMGGVSIDAATRNVFTATGNALTTSQSYRYAEHVVRLTPNLSLVAANYPGLAGTDVDFGGTPMLYHPPGCPGLLAVKNKNGTLFVYQRDFIDSGPLQRIQVASPKDGAFQNLPAYSPVTNMLYVSNSSNSSLTGPYFHGLVAFDIQPDCTIALAWQQTVGNRKVVVPPPTVANGVVYYADATGDQLFAFDAATGAHLWDSGTLFTAALYGAPMVVDGHVYIGGIDGHLHAFGL